MLVSVALRLLDHTEFSSISDICLTLESITLLYGKGGKKSSPQTHKLLVDVNKALNSVPAIKKALKGDKEENDTPHFALSEYVWCQDGGWGFWPGKVISIDTTFIVIQFYNKECSYITLQEAKRKIRPFFHDFDTLTKASTCRLDGFEEAVNRCLKDLLISRTLPEEVEKEVKGSASSDRWSQRMKNVSVAIQVICRDLTR